MSQDLLGNVFEPGHKSLLCRLQVRAQWVVASEHSPSEGAKPREFTFPLDAEWLSFSGDENSVLLLKNCDEVKLYSDRKGLEPLLRQAGNAAVRAKLDGEGKRAKAEGHRAWGGLLAAAASVALVCLLGLRLLNWGVDRAVDRIPVSWESNLGEAVVSSLGGPEIIDPAVTGPVQAVLDRVLTGAGEQPYKFTLHVVKDPQVNAMAAPGGQVIVYTGLLEKTSRPEELAGVLGHEIQHVLGRHGLRNVAHSVKWQVLASVVLGDITAVQGIILANGPQFLALSYSRGLEEEADLEGCRMLTKAGIDPKGLADFFRLLQTQEGAAAYLPEMISDHPETGRRIEAIEAFIATQPTSGGSYKPMAVDWPAMKKALANDGKLADAVAPPAPASLR